LQFGSRNGPLSEGSIPKRWNHVRFVLNWGFKLGVLAKQVSLSVPTIVDRVKSDYETDVIDDLIPTAYSEQQLQAVYEQLDGDLELQTAWVLGAFTGPRPGDLFAMRWQRNIRLSVDPADMVYIPEKTRRKRRHIWCPLGSIVVDHLRRLIRQQAHLGEPQGLVFPRLTDANRKNHEDGENSRARNRRIKRAMSDAGIPDSPDTERPWQMLRATANSRLNDCETGMGDRATHGAKPSVQGAFYTDYRDPLCRAVNKLDAQRLSAGVFRRR
jgi:integrase